MKKGVNASVSLKECRGNVERMIRRFTKKVKKAHIIEDFKEKRYYKKPSVARKEKRIRAERRRRKEERKRLRAQENRDRKKY
jgi:ribosomal protein S21